MHQRTINEWEQKNNDVTDRSLWLSVFMHGAASVTLMHFYERIVFYIRVEFIPVASVVRTRHCFLIFGTNSLHAVFNC